MSSRTIFGLLLIAVGLGLVLDRTGQWDFGAVLSMWWPLILILIAGVQLATRSAPPAASLLLLGVGVIFQSRQLGWLPSDVWSYLWPLLLVGVGAWLIVGRSFQPSGQLSTADRLNSFVAFGGANPRNDSSSFQGGSVTALFGGNEVDLRGAQLAADGAKLDVTVMFGGAEIIVPSDWRVRVTGLPILGGWDNKTAPSDGEQATDTEELPLCEINCFVAIGGIEVHN